jgi:CheY-like chemotaxis protein
LEDSGLYEVTKYSDPLLALAELKPNAFDLVLLDITMNNNIDGFELYEKMKKIDQNLKVCFIANYDTQEIHQARQ